jgi:hypothetical protein
MAHIFKIGGDYVHIWQQQPPASNSLSSFFDGVLGAGFSIFDRMTERDIVKMELERTRLEQEAAQEQLNLQNGVNTMPPYGVPAMDYSKLIIWAVVGVVTLGGLLMLRR